MLRRVRRLSGTAVLASLVLLVAPSGAAPPPANDECTAATPIGVLPFSEFVDTSAATRGAGDPFTCSCGTFDTRSVWWRLSPTAALNVTATTVGSTSYDTVIQVQRGSCAASTSHV